MTLIIAGVVFDSAQRLLQKGDKKRQLEPKVFSLLQSLVTAKGMLVTREQLITDVWNNRVVGEGAINRTVSLLRAHFAALTDRDVIETVPTQGYRLAVDVAEVAAADDVNEKVPTLEPKPNAIKSVFVSIRSIILIVIGGLIIWQSYSPQQSPLKLTLINGPLIALKGWEYKLSASRDGQSVLFHHLDAKNEQNIVVYDPQTHQQKTLLNNAYGVLSPEGTEIIYTQSSPSCVVSLYTIEPVSSTSLFNCKQPPAVMAWGADRKFYFNKRMSKSHPYQVFSFHLATQQLQQVTNPISDNNTRGDFSFSANQQTGDLAILRYVTENETQVIVYQGQAVQNTFQVNKRLKNIVWHPNNHDLIVADERVIYQLSTNNGALVTLQQLTSAINSLAIINTDEQASLLVSNSLVKSDVMAFDIATQEQQLWQQSGGIELLPRVQENRKMVLSTRFKGHQWWQINNDESHIVDVELPFELKFVRYELSNNGQRLLFSKLGAVYEIDIDNKTLNKIFDESHAAYVVNYDESNSSDIIYSANKSGHWQLWRYQRETEIHSQLTTAGGYSGRVWRDYLYYSKLTIDGLWRKKWGTDSEELVIKEFDRTNWLNWRIIDNHLYFYRSGSGVWRFDLLSQQEALIMKTGANFVHHYSVYPAQDKLYWIRRLPVEGDVYQYGF
ncbi:winged helix-turn-helix domain-containing protein [Psychrobium sp. nBUS_13]|uniref:winged helix-turn-helix domain-containing protein n=1 Tax=Psychrobium sp. nBUS_13 TaxID=3395319 RepID=UPI003EBBBE51